LKRFDPHTPIHADVAARVASALGTNLQTVLHFVAVLSRLALPAEEQAATKEDGLCLICDLVNDYEDGSLTTVALRLPAEQKAIWQDIGILLGAMDEADQECGNDAAVHRPAWARVREIARELRRRFLLAATEGSAEWTAEPSDLVAECRRILGADPTDSDG
jgi:hypothetical protein